MAADSYGWEGRAEWKQGHPEKAAPLFLTQLALGDESGIVSLKALVPDRVPIDGTLNPSGDQAPPGNLDNSMGMPPDAATLAALKAAASDPLLRRLVTAHILATGWGGRWSFSPNTTNARSQRWLGIINQVKPDSMQDAEYLGWLAYMVGDYKQALHWLDLSKSDSPAADWLHAKLQLRSGDIEGAAKSLAAAVDTLRSPALYTGWSDGAYHDANQSGPTYTSISEDSVWTMGEAASGDLGLMHLERGDFVQAMDILLKGGLWEDAAFIAERILSADELKAYVDKLPPATAKPPANTGSPQVAGNGADSPDDLNSKLRNLLGRRFVRENRYDEGAKYLAFPYDKVVQKYAAALKDGANTSLPKEQRAKAYFTAAWLARYDGMELMGTEVSPDGFDFGGDFPDTDLAKQRLTGAHPASALEADQPTTTPAKDAAPASKAEIQRLKKNTIDPDRRYHYRFVAAAIAMRAAPLLPDQTEELADVVNAAGNWIKNSDEQIGNRYFQVIDQHCSKTTIGGKASASHWFVDCNGPWSTAQAAAYDDMHKTYGDGKTAEQ
jgi:tetratricopeptide (TPR) repeat protein